MHYAIFLAQNLNPIAVLESSRNARDVGASWAEADVDRPLEPISVPRGKLDAFETSFFWITFRAL